MDYSLSGEKKKVTGPTKKWTKKMIDEELKKFEDRETEAKEREGDIEVRDAVLDRALFYKNEVEDFEKAEKEFRQAYDMSGLPSKKMEILFEILIMNLQKFDIDAIKKDVSTCKQLVIDGADWDKKNKFKIFEGVYCMLIRDFNKAAELFLSSVATFTCVELMDYKEFVFYTVVTSCVTQSRKTIKKEVIHSPDILAVIRELPELKSFVESYYNCDYKQFMVSFIEIIQQVKDDKYLDQHVQYFTKEMRLVAYRQYLESFKSVTIQNMAQAFGVSADFLDKELSNFIYIGKINCKIDKVSGIIESNRPNKKAELFNTTVKQGDILLNRVQQLQMAVNQNYATTA